MRYWLVGVVALAGCTGESSSPPESTYDGDPISLDVVASDGRVQIYARGDLSTHCTYFDDFPQPGSCGSSTDVSSCDGNATSCLTHVKFHGRDFDVSTHQVDDISLANDGSGGELEVDGCGGQWFATIPPGPYAATTPTAEYSETDTQQLVSTSWSPAADAATYLVSISFGFGGDLCHITETQHVFDVGTMLYDNRSTVVVQAFRAVVTDEEPTGTLRRWVGDAAKVNVHTPYPF